MQRILKRLLIVVALVMALSVTALYAWFRSESGANPEQPPYFDLFVSDKLFKDTLHSPFDIVTCNQRRPVEWLLERSQFERLDTVVVSLKNTSGEKFYYTSWGAPLTRLRSDLMVYRGGTVDTIPFGGFGCFTGVFMAPLGDEEVISRTMYNPLMFNPYSNYELPMESDSFPEIFRELYGDSVGIRFSQASLGLPWNEFPSQMLFSNRIVVRTDTLIENWRKGVYATFPEREPTMEEYYGMKNFPQ